MTIEVVSQQQALDRTAVSLGLRTGKITGNDLMPFLSQAVRRGALVLSPCGRGELEHAVFTTLGGLFAERETLAEQIEDAVENLLAFGDLLEMRAPSSESGRKSFVVRPAPFHYVVREDRSIVLLGTGIDEITPLSETLLKSIEHRGALRCLLPTPGEDLPGFLASMGFTNLSSQSWLHLPRKETAPNHLLSWNTKLSLSGRSGAIPGLSVIVHDSPVRFYKGRWSETMKQTGRFVGRRPQSYGSDIWCLVELEDGQATKVLDLASPGDKLRPCDVAWRIQMAFDAKRGHPQIYNLKNGTGDPVVQFFSPLPSWAERRLSISGIRSCEPGCLFAYHVRQTELNGVIGFIENQLWLTNMKN